jgi:hypothetical protein
VDGMALSHACDALARVRQEKGAFGMFDLTENQKIVAACSYSDGVVSIGKLTRENKVEILYSVPSLVPGFKPYYLKTESNFALLGSDCGSIFLLDFNECKTM